MRRRRRTRKPSPAENRTDHPKRRGLSGLVTTERIESEMRNVGSFLRLLDHQLPPTEDERERRRRSSILNEVATHLLVGSLIVVKEFLPSHYRALTAAALRFGETKLAGGDGRFNIRRVRPDGGFFETIRLIALLYWHERLTARFRAIWRKEAPAKFWSPIFRNPTPQHVRYQRRLAVERMTVAEVRAAVADLTQGATAITLEQCEIDREEARRLVRHAKGPADVSLAVLARVTNCEKRTVKARVIEGRRRLAEGVKLAAILEQRGYVSPAT
jgi:hypothetical protein